MMRTLLVPLAVAVVLAPAGAEAVRAAPVDPVRPVTVAPAKVWPRVAPCTTGTGPSEFTVSGTGFQPREAVTVTVGDVAYADLKTTAKGAYAQTYRVQSRPSGSYPVVLTGARGSRAEGSVYIGYAGCRSVRSGKLRVAGAGFATGDEVALLLDGGPAVTTDTGADGRFEVTVPCPAGKHTARVTGAGGRALSFTAFTC
jgi:hypothetical protein